ncbi:hypothetical protein PORY_000944 [Pneumocystis oryctolagi]|uniref:Uncharacterized protein n=1 Tax=Pneumocystis oryctolagi TaxID=42067 RepID=A0ACB7CEJ3_9ASCO|nr:hypothetical protein PORY_000944 [Pneumocystis oryctolagi]
MKPSVFWRGAAALLSVLAGLPRGEASNLLGVRIEPHQTQCFYTYVDQVENEPRAMLPEHEEKVHNPTGALDEFLYKISNSFAVIRNSQKSLRLRESRNLSTVRSTETRIVWFSLVESFLILVVSLLQVFVLKTFFTKTSFRV